MKTSRVIIFDTTLRDGEQCPGASMNLREKLEVARQLARLRVDVIEAGFPVISKGDFAAVQTIAKEVGAQTLVFNPLEGLTSKEQEQGQDYFSIQEQNLKNLQLALECQ